MQSSGRKNPFVGREPLKGTGREGFLRRGREGLGHDLGKSPAAVAPPELDQRVIRQVVAEHPRRVDRFVEKMTENKGVVKRVGADGIVRAVEECLSAHSVKRVLMNLKGL